MPNIPQQLSKSEIRILVQAINSEGSEADISKSIVAYIKQSHESPSTISKRIGFTLFSETPSPEECDKLREIREQLYRYLSKFPDLPPSETQGVSVPFQEETVPENPRSSPKDAGPSSAVQGASSLTVMLPSTNSKRIRPKFILSMPFDINNDFWLRMEGGNTELDPRNESFTYLKQAIERDRFSDIPCRRETNVNPRLHANRICVLGKNIAIACQYPLKNQLEAHIDMLFENRTPVLCVLSTPDEIKESQEKAKQYPSREAAVMLDYFTQDGRCGKYRIRSKIIGTCEHEGGIKSILYHLTIADPESTVAITIPTLHVQNWFDHDAISPDAVDHLARELIEQNEASIANYREKGSRACGDTLKLLAVIHCKAGAGRTGTIIAAMLMRILPLEITLEQIIKEIRACRNGAMVQTEDQMASLITLCQRSDRNLF